MQACDQLRIKVYFYLSTANSNYLKQGMFYYLLHGVGIYHLSHDSRQWSYSMKPCVVYPVT